MENEPAEELIKPQSLVTEENVKKTLLADKGKDAQLVSWKIVDFTKKGDNYISVVSSIEVKYSQNNKELDEVYIVKLNPCRGFKDFEETLASTFFKEVEFYLRLVPALNSILNELGLESLRFPQCFFGSLECTKEQIYMNDLRSKGFRMFDRKKGMDEDHATLVLKELARLHATSLLLEDKTKEAVEIKHDFLLKDFFTNDKMLPMLDSYVTTAVEMLKKIGGYERAISWSEGIKPQLQTLLTTGMQSDKMNVVNHGDCWNNNVLFRYSTENQPEDVMLLDVQVCRKCSLAIDLNYFMFTSLTGDVRKKNLNNFLSTYYDSFKEVMNAGGLDIHFTEEELLKEFRSKNAVGAFFGMMIVPIILLESDDVPDMTGYNDEDMMKIFAEFRAKSMAMLDKNPLSKSRFLSIFDDLMETGLIP